MYQALYRKYRPLTFEEVYGQDVIVKILKNAVEKEKISHAYLFTGPRGTGKTTIAKIMAKVLNCSDLNKTVPCDKCFSCIQINNKQNTDIIEIDAASNNGVDEIRELKSKINLVPSYGKYKIYIIDEVHMLTIGAFNALLKTLEEPPSHIIFILATTDPHKIPTTILSRCQRFDFKKISEDKIIERIKEITNKEKIEIEENAIKEIAHLSDGGLRDAISLLDQLISYADDYIKESDVHEINGTITKDVLIDFVKSIIENKIDLSLNMIDKFEMNGKNLIKIVEEVIICMKDILLSKVSINYFENDEYINEYKTKFKDISSNMIYEMIKELNTCLFEMKNSNNPKLIVQLSIIKLNDSEKKEITNNVKSTQTTEINDLNLVVKENKKTIKTMNVDNDTSNQNKIDEKREFLQQKKINENIVDFELKEKLKIVKDTRINNTLADFNKRSFIELKENVENVRNMVLNNKYSNYASIVLDGELKAAGNNDMIFVYESENISDLFNENLIIIEQMFKELFNKKYKVISTSLADWNIIKKEFNSKLKEYKYIEEEYNINDILKKNNDDLKKIFGDIVEYK